MSVRERCSCGAEFESDEPNTMKLVREWRATHKCSPSFDDRPVGGIAQVEQAPDFTVPELHVGFRPSWD